VRGPKENAGPNFRRFLEIDPKCLDIVIEDDELLELENYRRSNGKVLSVPDLAGAQIVVSLQNAPLWRSSANEPGIFKSYDPGVARRNIKVEAVRLELEVPGHRYTLTRPRLESRVVDGRLYLYATFPRTSEEMAELERDCIQESGVRLCRAPRSRPLPPPLPPPTMPGVSK
jgi:hypothetical protein